MSTDPMKNRDRDNQHRRRREVGEDEDEDDPDGRDVAEALYGGDVSALTDEDEGEDPDLFD